MNSIDLILVAIVSIVVLVATIYQMVTGKKVKGFSAFLLSLTEFIDESESDLNFVPVRSELYDQILVMNEDGIFSPSEAKELLHLMITYVQAFKDQNKNRFPASYLNMLDKIIAACRVSDALLNQLAPFLQVLFLAVTQVEQVDKNT